MKIKNRQNLLRTAGLLGVGTVLAVAPSFADSRNNHRENRDARRDVQNARSDVRESQRDLRDDRKDLRDAQRDLQHERRDDNRFNDHRNNNSRPVPLPRPLPQPNWNQSWNNQPNMTLEGTVISDFRGNGFTLRSNDGRQVFVQVQGGETYSVSRGDVVRVFGPVFGNRFNARSMRILVNR